MAEDREALEAHLITLAREYEAYVHRTEQQAFEAEEYHVLMAERSVVHDQLIALFDELRLPYTDRRDVRSQALAIARRGRL